MGAFVKPSAKRCALAALTACGLYALFYGWAVTFFYRRLLFADFDLAIHAQTLWNIAFRGSGFTSILGIHFLGNHTALFFYPLAGLYRLFPSPLLLMYLQTAALAWGGWLAYRLAQKKLEPVWALAIALGYLLHPAVGFANLFEFHPPALAVPLLFLALGAYIDARFWAFAGWSALSMAFQENLPLATAAFTILALAQRRPVRWMVFSAALPIAWFAACVWWVKPAADPLGTVDFSLPYSHLGKTTVEALLSPFTKPGLWIEWLFSAKTLAYALLLVAPFALLPLAGAEWLLPALPFFLQHALSLRASERAINYHYALEMLPYLTFAAAAGLGRFVLRFPRLVPAAALALAFAFAGSFATLNPYRYAVESEWASRPDVEFAAKKDMLSRIPAGASVIASFEFLPPLSGRERLYSLHHVWMGLFTMSRRPYEAPKDVEYALVNMRDPKIYGLDTPATRQNLAKFFLETPWQVLDAAGDTLLLQAGRSDLSKVLRAAGDAAPEEVLDLASGGLVLEGFTVHKDASVDRIVVDFYWRKTGPSSGVVQRMTFVDVGGRTVESFRRVPGYRIYTPDYWKEGERVVETYRLPKSKKLSGAQWLVGLEEVSGKANPFRGVRASPELDELGRAKILPIS